jgi:hypothetical protein
LFILLVCPYPCLCPLEVALVKFYNKPFYIELPVWSVGAPIRERGREENEVRVFVLSFLTKITSGW